jgi:hypothetical protein
MQEKSVENNLSIKIKRFFSFFSYSVLVIMGLLLLGTINEAAKVAGAFDVSEKHNVDLPLNPGVRLVLGVPQVIPSKQFPVNRALEIGTFVGHQYKHKNESQFSGFIDALINNTEVYIHSSIESLPTIMLLASPFNFMNYATSVRVKMVLMEEGKNRNAE